MRGSQVSSVAAILGCPIWFFDSGLSRKIGTLTLGKGFHELLGLRTIECVGWHPDRSPKKTKEGLQGESQEVFL